MGVRGVQLPNKEAPVIRVSGAVRRGEGNFSRRFSFVALSALAMGCSHPAYNCQPQIQALRGATNHADSMTARTAMITCVNTLDSLEFNAAARAMVPEGMNLAGMFFQIPEYHDEGRLPKGRDAIGTVLGPRAAIFASPFLNGFKRPSQIFEQGMPGTLAAIVFLEPSSADDFPQTYQNVGL